MAPTQCYMYISSTKQIMKRNRIRLFMVFTLNSVLRITNHIVRKYIIYIYCLYFVKS